MSNNDKNMNNVYYQTLTRNMMIIIIIVSFAPMLLVGGMIFNQFQTSYHQKIYDHLEEIVAKHTQNIDLFLNEKLADIRFMASSFTFEQLSSQEFLQKQLISLQEKFGPVFEDMGVVSEDGHQIAYAGPFKLGTAHYHDANWFKEAINSKTFISDVFLGLRGLPHFIVAVQKEWQGKKWLLRATIDFVAFNNLVENIKIGETGFALIINEKGDFQTQPFVDIKNSKTNYANIFESRKGIKEKLHNIILEDERGKKSIYISSFLKDGKWLLVYQQHAEDAFADLTRTRKIAYLIFLIGGIAIIVVALLLSKRMVSRISTANKEKEMMNQQVIETGKLASVGELAAGIAHEINNPVAIMVEEAGWIEDLLEEEEFKDGENLHEFTRALGQIRTQGRRCKEITHKLLSFARKTDSRINEVDVNDLLEEVISLSAQRAKYSNVNIEIQFQPNLPLLKLSQSEMQQVLLNLINNAIYAMEQAKGGVLNIKSSSIEQELIVEITDNGPGIPQANIGRIFDPFFTTKPVGKGTGLGLAICYGIINKMGGEIKVKSSVGIGTTFYIHLPVPKNSISEAANKNIDGTEANEE